MIEPAIIGGLFRVACNPLRTHAIVPAMKKKIPVLTKAQFAKKYGINRMRIDRRMKQGAPRATIRKEIDGIPDHPAVVKQYLED